MENRRHRGCTRQSDLPAEVLEHILIRVLPPEHHFSARMVCRCWSDAIRAHASGRCRPRRVMPRRHTDAHATAMHKRFSVCYNSAEETAVNVDTTVFYVRATHARAWLLARPETRAMSELASNAEADTEQISALTVVLKAMWRLIPSAKCARNATEVLLLVSLSVPAITRLAIQVGLPQLPIPRVCVRHLDSSRYMQNCTCRRCPPGECVYCIDRFNAVLANIIARYNVKGACAAISDALLMYCRGPSGALAQQGNTAQAVSHRTRSKTSVWALRREQQKQQRPSKQEAPPPPSTTSACARYALADPWMWNIKTVVQHDNAVLLRALMCEAQTTPYHLRYPARIDIWQSVVAHDAVECATMLLAQDMSPVLAAVSVRRDYGFPCTTCAPQLCAKLALDAGAIRILNLLGDRIEPHVSGDQLERVLNRALRRDTPDYAIWLCRRYSARTADIERVILLCASGCVCGMTHCGGKNTESPMLYAVMRAACNVLARTTQGPPSVLAASVKAAIESKSSISCGLWLAEQWPREVLGPGTETTAARLTARLCNRALASGSWAFEVAVGHLERLVLALDRARPGHDDKETLHEEIVDIWTCGIEPWLVDTHDTDSSHGLQVCAYIYARTTGTPYYVALGPHGNKKLNSGVATTAQWRRFCRVRPVARDVSVSAWLHGVGLLERNTPAAPPTEFLGSL